jgi:hypothetical protein
MLCNLIRVASLARMLGVSNPTVVSWAKDSGLTVIRAPLAGRATLSASPAYLTCTDAVTLIDHMLPRLVDRAANQRCRERARLEARRLADSTRNLTHTGGGTGLDRPPSKPAL